MNPWIAAGGTAVLMSERARHLLRRGVVFGIAGAIRAGETVAAAAGGVAHGAEFMASSGTGLAGSLISEARGGQRGDDEARAKTDGRSRRSRPAQPPAASR
jgi:hypothetical protein